MRYVVSLQRYLAVVHGDLLRGAASERCGLDLLPDDMTRIVAGQIAVQPGQRQRFWDGSQMAMQLARETTGCEVFVVAANPLDEHRVNVFASPPPPSHQH